MAKNSTELQMNLNTRLAVAKYALELIQTGGWSRHFMYCGFSQNTEIMNEFDAVRFSVQGALVKANNEAVRQGHFSKFFLLAEDFRFVNRFPKGKSIQEWNEEAFDSEFVIDAMYSLISYYEGF